MQTKISVSFMVHHHSLSDHSRFVSVITSLKVGKRLLAAGIHRSFGLTAFAVFQRLFSLVFNSKKLISGKMIKERNREKRKSRVKSGEFLKSTRLIVVLYSANKVLDCLCFVELGIRLA